MDKGWGPPTLHQMDKAWRPKHPHTPGRARRGHMPHPPTRPDTPRTPPDAPGHPRTPGCSYSQSIGRLINDSAGPEHTPNTKPKLQNPNLFHSVGSSWIRIVAFDTEDRQINDGALRPRTYPQRRTQIAKSSLFHGVGLVFGWLGFGSL